MRHALHITIACALALCATTAQAARLLQTDTRAFPRVRAWVEIEGDRWPGGTAHAVFDDKADPDLIQAIADAQEQLAKANAAHEELGWPAIPEAPVYEAAATVTSFDQRNDADQGLLVTFVIDASGSMQGKSFDRARRAIEAVLRELRPVDRVLLARIAGNLDILVPATTDHGAVRQALDSFEFVRTHARIYDALAAILQDKLANEHHPSLPGRRVLFLFSDGMDRGSALPIADFQNMFSHLQKPTIVITVGVGRVGHTHRDLARIATFAGRSTNFLPVPEPHQVAEAFSKAVAPLARQVRVDFEVPPFYWRQWADPPLLGRVVLTPTVGEQAALPVQLQLDKPLSEDALSRGRSVVETLEANRTRVAERRQALAVRRGAEEAKLQDRITDSNTSAKAADQQDNLVLYGGIGGATLLLLLLFVRISRKRRAEHRRLQDGALKQVEEGIRGEMKRGQEEADGRAKKAARVAADQARQPLGVLLTLAGPMKGQRFAILTPSCVAGRETTQCDLAFPQQADERISRQHARFKFGEGPGAFQVACLSAAGMEVNGTALVQGDHFPIQFGQQLTMGQSRFVLERP